MRLRAATVLAALCALLGACETTRTVDGARVSGNAALAGATEGDVHDRAAVRLRLAGSYYQNGQIEVAIETVQKALELDPNNGMAHALLGIMQLDLGKIESARANFSRAISLDGENPEIQNNYGWFLCRTGHEGEASIYFEKAAANRLYGTPGQALLNAGLCDMQAGELAAAEKHLLAALAADATSANVKYQLAVLNLRQRRLERADFYYDLLTRDGPPGVDALWLGIRIAHARKDGDSESRLANELRSRFPESAQVEALRRGKYDD